MLKKIGIMLLTAAIAAVFSGCESERIEQEIKLPILEGETEGYNTAVAEKRDFIETKSIGGSVGYVYSEALLTVAESNILEYNAKKNQSFKEGEVIAVFDSSALDYDYKNQKILTDDAYSAYAASGSEISRLKYEQEKLKLELIQYKIDQYTIRAPYDCVIASNKSFEIGSVVGAGQEVCTVAKPDEVYVFTNDSVNLFSTGRTVKLKFGTDKAYNGKIVMTPEGSGRRSGLNSAVIIKFEDGELEKVLDEVGNIVSAGWVTIIVTAVEKYNALAVPAEAVLKYSGSTYCYLSGKNGRARIPVEAGETYGGYTIINSGLTEGDIVSF